MFCELFLCAKYINILAHFNIYCVLTEFNRALLDLKNDWKNVGFNLNIKNAESSPRKNFQAKVQIRVPEIFLNYFGLVCKTNVTKIANFDKNY